MPQFSACASAPGMTGNIINCLTPSAIHWSDLINKVGYVRERESKMMTHLPPPVVAMSPQAPSSLRAVPSSHPPVSPFLIPCLLLRQGHHRSASVVPPPSSAPSEVIVVRSGPPGVGSTMPTVTPLLGRVDADLTPPQPSARSAPCPVVVGSGPSSTGSSPHVPHRRGLHLQPAHRGVRVFGGGCGPFSPPAPT
jgi:hypothetical protein